MKKREFGKLLNSICTGKGDKKRLDVKKIPNLTVEQRTGMALYLIRERGPVIKEFLTPEIDRSWLNCMGYMYETTGKKSGYTFVHTCEHKII